MDSNITLTKKLLDVLKDDVKYNQFNQFMILHYLQDIIELINHTLRQTINNTQYIGPLRAPVNRYYRVSGVETQELSSDGDNLAMLLNNMTTKEKNSFKEFTKKYLNKEFLVKKTEGHVSIVMKDDKSQKEVNLTDVGFGYSQIMPIILSVWNLMLKNTSYRNYFLLLVEQPELHLHPSFQMLIIEMISNLISDRKDNNFILETHSETIINGIGYLVKMGKISKEDVNIVIFKKDNEDVEIKEITFDENGRLMEWPTGFFSYLGIY